jgi:peptidoglycan/xylan/chitin deacetylase (PgdA/CDA1 family)
MPRFLLLCELVGKVAAVWCWVREPGSLAGYAWFFAPDPLVLYHLFVPSAQGFCRTFTRFETPRQEIWLTIDDGPDPDDTPQILELLERHQARATFFLIGKRAARWPQLVAEIARRGHEVGHHTQRHPVGTLWCASRARLNAELDDALAVFRAAGVRPTRFRAPVGIKHFLLGGALASRELACVGWSVRSGDCLGRRAEDVVASVMKRVKPGAIVLVHEGPSVPDALRVRTIALLLDALGERGISCVIPEAKQLRP